jgi:HNH endonuclease
MRRKGFIPQPAKSEEHEARNGITLCSSHHRLFDAYRYYIRWIPEVRLVLLWVYLFTLQYFIQARRFVLINHSKTPGMEQFHGHAVRLRPDDPRAPFHGCFLFHEMRVRGHHPLCEDRPRTFPIQWQSWIPDNEWVDDDDVGSDGEGDGDDSHEGDGDGDDSNEDDGDGHSNTGNNNGHLRRTNTVRNRQQAAVSSSSPQRLGLRYDLSPKTPRNADLPKTIILTNPFANPSQLESLKRNFSQQPNWTASLIEGESWEGTAEENIMKWRNITDSGSLE